MVEIVSNRDCDKPCTSAVSRTRLWIDERIVGWLAGWLVGLTTQRAGVRES
jgi:hypothetical protein